VAPYDRGTYLIHRKIIIDAHGPDFDELLEIKSIRFLHVKNLIKRQHDFQAWAIVFCLEDASLKHINPVRAQGN
jgi:hypothetical protein